MLQKPSRDPNFLFFTSINDNDKNGFMTTIHELDRTKGLDLILHTPGGDAAATESLVYYLRQMFEDIRTIIPQLAMSAGTMIAMSCRTIVMGKQSSLGPIDPQIMGIPAHAAIKEFEEAFIEIKKDPTQIPIWQARVARFPIAFIKECRQAIDWSDEIVKDWLITGMFKDLTPEEAEEKVDKILEEFGDHSLTKSHSRHISALKGKETGLKIEMLEDDQKLQEAVLSLHHSVMLTLTATPAIKIIENHKGKAFIQTLPPI